MPGSEPGSPSRDGSGDGSRQQQQCTYRYLLRDAAVLLRGSYSMVLTKGAMLHRDWLATYSAMLPPEVLAYVEARRNCEDIAMAFLVASVTGRPPHSCCCLKCWPRCGQLALASDYTLVTVPASPLGSMPCYEGADFASCRRAP